MMGTSIRLIAYLSGLGALLYLLNQPTATGFAPGPLLDPLDGLYWTAVAADPTGRDTLELVSLDGPVRIVRDDRGVPHIFAESDRDAIIALGYVTAQDRLFQIDFLSRVASGRIAEVLGPSALDTDRFFRSIGLKWSIENTAAWLQAADHEQLKLISWFDEGANTWISNLEPKDDPFEFRLFGYRPELLRLEDALAVLVYMSYDLTYTDRDRAYSALKAALSPEDYEKLYPSFSPLAVPIVNTRPGPLAEAVAPLGTNSGESPDSTGNGLTRPDLSNTRAVDLNKSGDFKFPPEPLLEGFVPGKGSNNWAVSGSHSETGLPILAGDMHLNLSLPSIWYEAHLVSPGMNVYGVTIPGAPVIVAGTTPVTAWTFTNTGSDQIDYFRLLLNEDRSGYVVDDEVEAFKVLVDTIRIARAAPVVDTLLISRFGPVSIRDGEATAIRWTAHDTTRTLLAIWEMAHAQNYSAFEQATRLWDAPMQNILFAGVDGTIAIRSTGYLPLRGRAEGSTVIDGTMSSNDWVGRVPFEELPHMVQPEVGFLTSTNQPPADSTYPYYLGHDWRDAYRSIRIDRLLRSRSKHTVSDIKSYQSDVHAVQADLLRPHLASLEGLSENAEELRAMLLAWDGETGIESTEPFFLLELLDHLSGAVWDEAIVTDLRKPSETVLFYLLDKEPNSIWFDHQNTSQRETAEDILTESLEAVAERHASDMDKGAERVHWGDKHVVVFKHLTRSAALRPLWRGPYPYPGFDQTLSPAASMETTHSASWRVVVDFSNTPPNAFGVYPGGQSGNPFSRRYASQIGTYMNFEYYPLNLADNPAEISVGDEMNEVILSPSSRR